MRVVKPQQLSFLNRPFEYRGSAYLGVSIIAALPLLESARFVPEVVMWDKVIPALGDQGLIDAGIPKRGGEFLAAGHAFSPEGRSVTSMRVGVEVGAASKELWVFGDRFMHADKISEPEPFDSMPLSWDHAFGGEGFKPNPLGKGYRASMDAMGNKRHWLPNIEHPAQLYRLKGQHPEPANFGPVDMVWPQRMSLAGTYDDRWLKTAFPGFPDDIRWEYFNLGSRDQWLQQPLSGDESYRIYGMHPEHPVIEGTLPSILTRCFYIQSGSNQLNECTCRLTTLWFLPDVDLLVLVHHGSIKVREDDGRDIESIMIAAEHQHSPRDLDHYQDVLNKRADPDGDPIELIQDAPLMPEGMAQSILQPMLDEIEQDEQSPLVRNLEAVMAEAIETARADSEQKGIEFPEADVPEMPKRSLPRLEELDGYLEEKLEQLEQTRRLAEERKQEELANARERLSLLDSKNGPNPDEMESSLDAVAGPPRFSAAGQRRSLLEQIEQIRAIGQDPGALQEVLDSEEQFADWQEAERQLNDLYRAGAHFQQPAGPASDSQSLRSRLFELLEAGADLTSVDFTGIDLSNVKLRGCDLRGVFMECANLEATDLTGAKLDRAVLAHAHLDGTILDETSLKEANLGSATLERVSARNAVFEETIMQRSALKRCDFSGSTMSGMQLFLEAELDRCIFAGGEISDLFVNERSLAESDFSGSTLIDPIFLKAELGRADFSGAVMEGSVFIACAALSANFVRAKLAGSVFVDGCNMSDSDFSGADLARANLRGSVLLRCRFDGATLTEADLSEAEASGASFKNAEASQSRWVRADLREADLSGVLLVGAVLQKADIRGTDLRANLYKADLARVHVERSTMFDGAFTAKMNTYPRKFPAEPESHG